MKRKFLKTIALGLSFMFANSFCAAEPAQDLNAQGENFYALEKFHDEGLMSYVWIRNSAEYRALCYQAYNAVKTQVELAVKNHKRNAKPLAIVLDIDETVLLNTPHHSSFVGRGDAYKRQSWVDWCNAAIAEAMPGAVDCMQYVDSKGVTIFYVSNRHVDTELDGTMKNFEKLGFPQVEKSHFLFKTDSSYKQPRFDEVAKKYDVILYMGDNCGDFPLETYGKLNAARNSIIDKNQNSFGTKYIVFPNPTYGAWEDNLVENYSKLSAQEKSDVRRDALKQWSSIQNNIENLLTNSATAQKTDQIILVIDHTLSLWNKIDGKWKKDFESYCGYGSNGLSWDRTAGDKTTPIGAFPILYAFGQGDNPGTEMTYKKITPKSYLSGEKSSYNTWVESSRRISGEHLQDYYQYEYAMNIGFNINPTVYGKGAAIFLHCKSMGHWTTAGCVSVPEDVMLKLLRKSHNGEYIIIVPTAADIAKF